MKKEIGMLAAIAVIVPLMGFGIYGVHNAFASDPKEDYKSAFDEAPPANSAEASQRGHEVLERLEDLQNDQTQLLKEYESFQRSTVKYNREAILDRFRNEIAEDKDRLDTACDAAHHYKIPPQFTTPCN